MKITWRTLGWLLFSTATLSAASDTIEGGYRGGTPSMPAISPPPPALPQPGLVAFARARGIALDPVQPPAESAGAQEGDAVTFLITLRDRKSIKQWLTVLTVASATVEELAKQKPRTIEPVMDGRKYSFSGTATVALEARTYGPFVTGDDTAPAEKAGRTLISPDFLALGLDQVCEALVAMDRAEKAAGNDGAKSPRMDEKSERAFAGMFPALMAFFEGIDSTPGLREIMWKVIDRPSIWSFVVKRGFTVGFTFSDGSPANILGFDLPGRSLHQMKLELVMNDKKALTAQFFVTAPKPPLLTSAGIVRIVAGPPSNRDKEVDIRVVAATRGAPAVTPGI